MYSLQRIFLLFDDLKVTVNFLNNKFLFPWTYPTYRHWVSNSLEYIDELDKLLKQYCGQKREIQNISEEKLEVLNLKLMAIIKTLKAIEGKYELSNDGDYKRFKDTILLIKEIKRQIHEEEERDKIERSKEERIFKQKKEKTVSRREVAKLEGRISQLEIDKREADQRSQKSTADILFVLGYVNSLNTDKSPEAVNRLLSATKELSERYQFKPASPPNFSQSAPQRSREPTASASNTSTVNLDTATKNGVASPRQ